MRARRARPRRRAGSSSFLSFTISQSHIGSGGRTHHATSGLLPPDSIPCEMHRASPATANAIRLRNQGIAMLKSVITFRLLLAALGTITVLHATPAQARLITVWVANW